MLQQCQLAEITLRTGIYRIAIRIIHRGHALVEVHTELEDSVG